MSRAANKLIAAAAGASTEASDDDFANVVLLLDGDGTNGANNVTYTDSSSNSHTMSLNGGIPQGSVSPYGDNWSNYFQGGTSNECITFTGVTANGTGDATIECWFFLAGSTSYQALIDTRSGSGSDTGFAIFTYDNRIEVWGNGKKVESASNSISPNTWIHFALVRSSGTCQIYLNGTASGSSGSYSDNLTSGSRSVARNVNGQNEFLGYISNLREVHSAVYTSNFTPSTTPLSVITNTQLLTCCSNRFQDKSNSHSVTVVGTPNVTSFSPFKRTTKRTLSTDGGSGFWHANNTPYLSFSGGPSTVGDMTISFWIYAESMSKLANNYYPRVFSSGLYNASPAGLLIYLRDDDIRIYHGGEIAQTDLNLNEWNYIVAQRSSGTWTLYRNGSNSGSGSSSTNVNLSSANYIGSEASNGYTTGYISDFRITTSGSTSTSVPTSPVSSDSDTELLLNFHDAGIYDLSGLSNFFTTTASDPVSIDTSTKKYGTGSILFDGNNDELVNNSGSNQHLFHVSNYSTADGDFTVEFWADASAIGTNIFIGSGVLNNTAASNWWVETVAGVLKVYMSNGSSYTILSDTVGWGTYSGFVHVAWVNYNGTSALYINGTSKATVTTPSTNMSMTSELYIGAAENQYEITGNLDDIRISKGLARYTSNFTPPTEALPKF
jgi:hypothetical protein